MKLAIQLLLIFASILFLPVRALAYVDGQYSNTCYARNSLNGQRQAVMEENVGDSLGGASAITSRLQDGRWLIQWNVPKMIRMTSNIRLFLFFHECAHARTGSSDENTADCEGLKQMFSELGPSTRVIAEIAEVYRSGDGRQFPPRGCDY